MACLTFIVRVVDIDRQAFTAVCEQCGAELPIGALNLVDVDALGHVLLEHASPPLTKLPGCMCGSKHPGAVCGHHGVVR